LQVFLLIIFYSLGLTNNQNDTNNPVQFVWSGGVSSSSVVVKAKLTDDFNVRLVLSTQADFSNLVYSDTSSALQQKNNRIVTFSFSGLSPDTRYYYAVVLSDSLVLSKSGSFTTFPEQAKSFSFAFSSCASTASNSLVFETIQNQQPLFFLHAGDFHYENINSDNIGIYRETYETVLSSQRQSDLYRSTSIAYTWDDHDYGPGDSDSTYYGRKTARLSYQEYVPHYPLVAGSGDVPIYQAFSVGRVRFILTDNRSKKAPFDEEDRAGKSILGKEQKAWLKQELLQSNNVYPVIFWVNSVPWIGTTGSDGWHGYTFERREIANFIKDNDIKGIIMLSGDAHMLAIDDGTNSDYADNGGAEFPVFHAAALDRRGSVKGGPYSHGTFPGKGHFGFVTISDSGGSNVDVSLSGRDSLNSEVVSLDVSLNANPTGLSPVKSINKTIELYPAYPNPFNPETVISYFVSQTVQESSVHVIITIYDISGKKIKTLVDTRQPVGTYSITFNASTLPSGVYFYNLKTSNGYSKSRKMLLLK